MKFKWVIDIYISKKVGRVLSDMTSEKEKISCAEVPRSSLTHMNLANRFAHSVELGFLFYMARKVESFLEACLRMSIPYILYSLFQKTQKTYKSMPLACVIRKQNQFLEKCSRTFGPLQHALSALVYIMFFLL